MRITLPSGGTATVSEDVKPETVEALDQMCKAASKVDAQKRLDETHMELNELFRQVAEKERELAEYDFIVHPEDYE